MKRKQKQPRRTRPNPFIKTSTEADVNELTHCNMLEMKKGEDFITKHSKDTEHKQSNVVETVHLNTKQQNIEDSNLKDIDEKFANDFHNIQFKTSNEAASILKRPTTGDLKQTNTTQTNPTQTNTTQTKTTPDLCTHLFEQCSQRSSMPVIESVFTLSEGNVWKQFSSFMGKGNASNENNFPITPQCSPPLSEQQLKTCAKETIPIVELSSSPQIFWKPIYPFVSWHTAPTECFFVGQTENVPANAKISRPLDYRGWTSTCAIDQQHVKSEGKCYQFREISPKDFLSTIDQRTKSLGCSLSKVNIPSYNQVDLSHSLSHSLSNENQAMMLSEVKVLQLKKRLHEQEEALKKLRTKL
ncbi:uncharacterized protein LOC124446670 [Xenia sp. Carnegie-2017]|uniref:uncharacterized protein LOC124446670 n=1 Tax=Xenia sp. Carnegie-2017 TaxID=2897299 RepID=UPI001F03DB33|nr:uncharacterized protein LOC124446670 [Xenia sp. Carnegie-2017]